MDKEMMLEFVKFLNQKDHASITEVEFKDKEIKVSSHENLTKTFIWSNKDKRFIEKEDQNGQEKNN